ncbi:peptide/nickel transport system ATP-binding protein [Lachnotalea glycerini]|uniref:Nickel import system ATP-binding protein NikD n=1 Tax=Lachnotalea glycerini TaxID=1763509 RepID=A0A318ENU3_9FIRM|nr:ABC transporter ATP-binding protein [Lachnotalea glycerini]OYO42998.1 hypothetical protein CG709_20740 [Lachnotalea glycerini]PXV91793.1 peptide/nickel transport system ATP-binding protein [Lachnotalea glycerini]
MRDIRLDQVEIRFPVKEGFVEAAVGVTTTFQSGEITAIIGESGCGKSVLGLAILGLLPIYAQISGSIWLGENDLFRMSPKQMRNLRGREIGFIAQNPADSLNPVRKIKGQLMEAIRLSQGDFSEHNKKLYGLLKDFGFPKEQLTRVLQSYPFQLSGGMKQRISSAMGIASDANWILADEPSKGLDYDLREQTYENLRQIKKHGVEGMIIITHDIVLAEKLCDSVAVMYSGQIIEKGKNVLSNPRHPYTKGLLDSFPSHGMHAMEGKSPAPGEIMLGCRFASRCSKAMPVCRKQSPTEYGNNEEMVRCFLYD